MLYTERVELILQQLQLQATVKITDLTELLQVSVDTVRRDLKSMEQSGLVRCVRGGACLPESLSLVSNFAGREIINIDTKREAAKKALKYAKSGMVIALNSGTTNTILAQEMVTKGDGFTVVTNNYEAIRILMQCPSIEVIAVGGKIDTVERSTCGTQCEREFARYYPDLAFLSINAVSYQDGFTDFRFSEMGVMQILADQSKKVIAVMDSSKIGKRSRAKLFPLTQVDRLVTDTGVTEKMRHKYEKHGLIIE
ncbi:MAG TPA: DeoR/GlpR family DNA-binding transcription regulator [Candidatus Hungatella pullicola]|nr:DeoR/GlpR family DNA-binding transcription regulator [Candidatus Hungatella pullicola]